jgi:type II secretory pathway pseudopilin PulG
MFGLDARIALAIFAILAVVAGYLAFGRVAIARQAALMSELDAIHQALDAYPTDMGTFFLFTLNKSTDDQDSSTDITALWDVNMVKPGFRRLWQGPYLHRTSRDIRGYGKLSAFYATGNRKDYCSVHSDCYVWLSVSSVPAATWKSINRTLDEGNGVSPEAPGQDISSGRIQSEADTDPRPLYYRTVERR